VEEKTDKRILIVDDDTEFVKEFSHKIEAQGLRVHSAITPKEALDYIAQNEVDFLILDFVMPEMDGYTFYHILKHDMRKNIPTVILTNMAGTQDADDLEVFIKSETNLDELIGKIKSRVDELSDAK
jgi:CheY-like chemotaxis protein